MRTIDIKKATGALADYASGVQNGPLVVLDHGKPVAALVSLDDSDLESISLGSNAEFIALIQRARERSRTEGTLSHEEVLARFGLDASDQDEPAPGPRTRARKRSA